MNHSYKFRYRLNQLKAGLQVPMFICMVMVFWLYHILFRGWYLYLFHPDNYLIRAGDILEDIGKDHDSRSYNHKIWWHRDWCDAGKQAAILNDPDALVLFTVRTHPIFLDNEYLYVSSPKYKARWWDERVKIYSVPK